MSFHWPVTRAAWKRLKEAWRDLNAARRNLEVCEDMRRQFNRWKVVHDMGWWSEAKRLLIDNPYTDPAIKALLVKQYDERLAAGEDNPYIARKA